MTKLDSMVLSMGLDIEIIGAGIGCGAQDTRTAAAAQRLKELKIERSLRSSGIPCRFDKVIDCKTTGARLEALPGIVDFSERLAAELRSAIAQHAFPVVLGGDHSCAVGTWSGIRAAMTGELGLIWIDAHMDAHTPETTETGAVHGMPLAALLGYGDSRLSQIKNDSPKLCAENLALIGIRSFERGEAKLLENLGVRIFYMNEVEARGFQACFDEALEIVTRSTQGFGITVDLDSFDPSEVPAVGSPAPGGLRVNDVCRALEELNREELVGLEIVEYNPDLDANQNTYLQICRILKSALKPRPMAQLTQKLSRRDQGQLPFYRRAAPANP